MEHAFPGHAVGTTGHAVSTIAEHSSIHEAVHRNAVDPCSAAAELKCQNMELAGMGTQLHAPAATCRHLSGRLSSLCVVAQTEASARSVAVFSFLQIPRMAKGAKKTKQAAGSSSPGAAAANEQAVLDLRMDSSTPEAPREVAATASFSTPCTIQGCMAGLSGGALGYVFGFGEGCQCHREDAVGVLRGDRLPPVDGCLFVAAINFLMRCGCRRVLDAQHQGRGPMEGSLGQRLGLCSGACCVAT